MVEGPKAKTFEGKWKEGASEIQSCNGMGMKGRVGNITVHRFISTVRIPIYVVSYAFELEFAWN